MLSVADHHGAGRDDRFLSKNMGDQFSLVRSGSVELASIYVLKKLPKAEVSDYLAGKYCWLGGYDKEPIMGSLQCGQSIGDTRVKFVLEHSLGSKALPVQTDRSLNEFDIGSAKQCGEAFMKRRSDVTHELIFRRFRNAKLPERILKTMNDPLARITKRAV
jgi:hypothetical protein